MGAIESLAANLVPGKDLPNAYTLVNAGYYSTRLIGPGVIAALMGVVDLKWIFLTCASFYGVGLILVLQVHTVSTGVVERGRSLIYNALSGRQVRLQPSGAAKRHLPGVVPLHAGNVLRVAAARDLRQPAGRGRRRRSLYAHDGRPWSPVSLDRIGPIRGEGLRGRLFLLTAVVSSLGNVFLGIAPSLPIAMLGLVVIGVSHTGFMTLATIMIQSVAPDALRGRITSIYLIHAGGMMSFSYFANGALADVFEPTWILTVGGVAFLGVVVASLFISTPRSFYRVGVSTPVGAASG